MNLYVAAVLRPLLYWRTDHSRACFSPNSTWLVTSRHDTNRHVRRDEPMHFGCVELVEQHGSTHSTGSTRRARLARQARRARNNERDRRDSQLGL